MLVVSMKEDGILRIGDVDVYIREIRGGQVKVCVRAPKEVRIEHLEAVLGETASGEPEVTHRARMGRR